MVRLIPVSLFFRLVLAMMIDSTRIGLKLLVISFSRDSYNKKKGLDQEEAKTKYAEKLKEVREPFSCPNFCNWEVASGDFIAAFTVTVD